MNIFSKFQDYYDSALGCFLESDVKVVRNIKSEKVLAKSMPNLDDGTLIEEDDDTEVKYIQAATLDEWKSKVIGSLPKGASMKMRMDIEEFLDGIKNVY